MGKHDVIHKTRSTHRITGCNTGRPGPNHGYKHRKFGEVRTRSSRDMLAVRETNKKRDFLITILLSLSGAEKMAISTTVIKILHIIKFVIAYWHFFAKGHLHFCISHALSVSSFVCLFHDAVCINFCISISKLLYVEHGYY